MTYINLGYNEIGDEGAKAIGEALKVNTSLNILIYIENNIGDEGKRAIGEDLLTIEINLDKNTHYDDY